MKFFLHKGAGNIQFADSCLAKMSKIAHDHVFMLDIESIYFLKKNLSNRAGKPPPGLHLDCMKDGKMIQVMAWIQYMYFKKNALGQWYCSAVFACNAFSLVQH